MIKNKGQVGETLTWIVATIIIIIMIIFFIFGASLLGETKKIGEYRSSLTSSSTFEGSAPFLMKSLFTYALMSSTTNRLIIDRTLSKMAEEGDFALNYNETKKEILLRYGQK